MFLAPCTSIPNESIKTDRGFLRYHINTNTNVNANKNTNNIIDTDTNTNINNKNHTNTSMVVDPKRRLSDNISEF